MTPEELLSSHRYTEAIDAYEQVIRARPDEDVYAPLGSALLGLRNFDEAIKSFKRDIEFEGPRVKGHFPSLNELGTALWLAGRQREAIAEWHRAAAGILDGTFSYGDLAGGGTQGLLLWYGAVTLKDEPERKYAFEYLQTRAARKTYGAICWPRPAVLMVLGEKSSADALEIAAGSRVLSACLEKARRDLLSRRQLCQALFYSACQQRQAGNEKECIEKMRVCSQLENPIIECEWYLARGESED